MSLIGETKLRILRLLDDAPSHGYKIHKEIGVTTSTVYQHLNELEAAGMIEPHSVDGDTRTRTEYTLTDDGRQLLDLLSQDE
ncbi:DNA-binding PadR family transcriptional regulator [Halorubrum trapanicum]|uniref:DNA-binding PadR family transcriptional regulator n=1 Tax=Halorubrum trapanicum TaxID=29284 RepID=A0A8J7R3T8_9EURY|nr:helix-turn-helix transcriptional regulator [Halorubrum trapanicum]MBP1901329.1 DNA-binding PadR family transcriptional regulator [Halorubrum trapanicum]